MFPNHEIPFRTDRAAPDAESWPALLRSQGLGVACGLATVTLLAAGSFVLSATRDGASAGIGMDDLRPFFTRPSLVHAWFYLLVPVLALYALNTLLATWHALAVKVRRRVRSPGAYAPSVVHLGFLVALLAHGVGGLFGGERGGTVLAVDGGWRPLPGGREARLLALDVERLPGGMPKEVRARLDVRDTRSGHAREHLVGYNEPLSFAGGSELHLLGDLGRVGLAELSVGGERCRAVEGESCDARLAKVQVLAVVPPRHGAPGLVHVLAGGARMVLAPGRDVPLPNGLPLRLEEVRSTPGLLLRSRSAPGNPVALAAAALMAAGIALMGRRFFAPRGQVTEEEIGEAA